MAYMNNQNLTKDYIQSIECNADIEWGGEEDSAPQVIELTIPIQKKATRLDKILAELLPQYSRSRLQQWIENKQVQVDQMIAISRRNVVGGERIQVKVALLPELQAFQAEAIPLNILYEDTALLVLYKPAGMVVHPAAGNWSGTLLNGLLHYDPRLAHVPRAGIVHRLDKDTSGLMVVARNLEAQTDLIRQLQARTVKREYLALVWGEIKQIGVIQASIARDPYNPLRMAVTARGKQAITHYQPLNKGFWADKTQHFPVTLVSCQLETGRTHQIRVHMHYLGYPLIGDKTYGKAKMPSIFPRQALHAWRLTLAHPQTGKEISWQQAIPDEMQQLLKQCGIE